MPVCLLSALLVLGTLPAAAATAATPGIRLVYPRPDCSRDERSCYPVRLLGLAMERAGEKAVLVPTGMPMRQGRAVRELEGNTGRINVMWTMTSREREAALLPIRIPLDKGLFGWRVSLIRADRFDLFRDVASVTDLGRFVAGQGHDWPDTGILKAAGLPVETADSFESLFSMLSGNRFDYFPRSVIEAWSDVEKHRDQGLIVDTALVIHYPTALYFFVARQDTRLAAAIKLGLERAIADGSFDRLFYGAFAREIERANLTSRRVITLPNPLLPEATPLARRELWFKPQDLSRP